MLWKQMLGFCPALPSFGWAFISLWKGVTMVAASTDHGQGAPSRAPGTEHGLSNCQQRCGLQFKSSVSWGPLLPTMLQHRG